MRADLMALTPEAVAALSNVGLVKRALRESERGGAPAIEEEADGTVVGTFEDGAIARLTPGRALRDCTCSCSASGLCRHLVAAALAYRSFAERAAGASDPTALDPSAAVGPAPGPAAWSPGAIGDEAIARALSPRALADAQAAARRGMLIEVVRGAAGEPPVARLPACTVRFLVPHDLLYARCDCAERQPCAHAALGVWAFRIADAREGAGAGDRGGAGARSAGAATVEVRHGAPDAQGDADQPDAAAVALVLELVAGGVVDARAGLAQRFVLAREALLAAGHIWTATALDDLEVALERYRERSARYRAGEVLSLAAEIVARGRAARAPDAELPAGAILGRGEAAETRLDHLRLVGLGCRFDGDERERHAEVLLADPDTGTVLVLEKTWRFAPGETAADAGELARRRLGGGALSMLASGQITTRVARRRANRVLVLGAGGQGGSSVVPQTGDLSILPRPLRVDRIDELTRSIATRPPRLLRPRVRGEDVHAIAVGGIEGVVFDAAAQTLVARAVDPAGQPFLLRRGHRRIVPHALDVLGRVLLGEHGAVRWVAGEVQMESGTLVVEPTLVVADRVVVPDVEPGAPTDLPRGSAHAARDRVAVRLDAAWSALEELVQLGLAATATSARLEAAASGLAALGMEGLRCRVQRVVDEVSRARQVGDAETRRAAASAIVDAAIRLELAREAHVSSTPSEPSH